MRNLKVCIFSNAEIENTQFIQSNFSPYYFSEFLYLSISISIFIPHAHFPYLPITSKGNLLQHFARYSRNCLYKTWILLDVFHFVCCFLSILYRSFYFRDVILLPAFQFLFVSHCKVLSERNDVFSVTEQRGLQSYCSTHCCTNLKKILVSEQMKVFCPLHYNITKMR